MARRRTDGKAKELTTSRTLNPHPESVSEEAFVSSEFFDARDLVQVKYEMVRRVEAEGASPTAMAGAFGLSRQSYYSLQRGSGPGRERAGGPAAGQARAAGAHKLTDEVLEHLQELRRADPSLRPAQLAAAVDQRFGVSVHPRSVERAFARWETTRSPKSG